MNKDEFTIWGLLCSTEGVGKALLYNGHIKGFKGIIEFYTDVRIDITSFKRRGLRHGVNIGFDYE